MSYVPLKKDFLLTLTSQVNGLQFLIQLWKSVTISVMILCLKNTNLSTVMDPHSVIYWYLIQVSNIYHLTH